MSFTRLPHPWTRLQAIAALSALILVTGACGGDGDRAEASGERSATTAVDGDRDSTDQQAEAPSRDLESMALTLDDMPTGWTTAANDSGDEAAGDEAAEDDDRNEDGARDDSLADDCDVQGALIPDDVEAADEVERTFEKSQMGPFVFQTVGRFGDSNATRAMELVRSLVEVCADYSMTDPFGAEVSGTFSEMSFPSFGGDETFGTRFTIEGEGFLGEGDLVAVREGDDVVFTFGMQMTFATGGERFAEGEFEQIVEAAVTRAFPA